MPAEEEQAQKPAGEGEQQQLPEKFRGKSPAELAKMYEDLEAAYGRQAHELGELRAYVSALQSAPPPTAERRPATKDEYGLGEIVGDLLVEPEEVLPKVAQRIEEKVAERVSRALNTQLSVQRQIEAWFQANPDLEQFKEIVSVIGERIYQANPTLPLDRVLELTGREARAYIASLRPRLLGEGHDRKKAGITTSGGGRARETAAAGAGPEERGGESGLTPEQQAVMDEIRRIKEFRARRLHLSRAKS